MKKNKFFTNFTEGELWLFFIFFSMVVMMVGMTANFKVIQTNGGKMPVEVSGPYWFSDTHFTFQNRSEVSYYYFSDIIHIGYITYSIGDLIMLAGASGMITFLFYFYLVKHRELKQKGLYSEGYIS